MIIIIRRRIRIGSQLMLNSYVRHTSTPHPSDTPNTTSSPTYIRIYPPTHNHHPTRISIRRKLAPQPTHLFPHLQLLLVSTQIHRCTNHIYPQTKIRYTLLLNANTHLGTPPLPARAHTHNTISTTGTHHCLARLRPNILFITITFPK